MKLQTCKRTFRTICFSPEKHDKCKATFESSSPVKITKFQLKTNCRTNEEEILINRSKLDDPQDEEITFDIIELPKQPEYMENIISIDEIKNFKPGTPIDVSGRISFQGEVDVLNVRGNDLRKQESVMTDESGTIRLVLWEADIANVQSELTYNLKRAIIREFDNRKYITLNKQTKISQSLVSVTRSDEDVGNLHKEFNISCPPEGVPPIQMYLSCQKFSNLMVSCSTKNIKCTKCGLNQFNC